MHYTTNKTITGDHTSNNEISEEDKTKLINLMNKLQFASFNQGQKISLSIISNNKKQFINRIKIKNNDNELKPFWILGPQIIPNYKKYEKNNTQMCNMQNSQNSTNKNILQQVQGNNRRCGLRNKCLRILHKKWL